MRSYYEILETDKTATDRDIKKAYFKLVRKFPPDRFQKEFMEIRTAYEILIDPKTREEYDKINDLPKELMIVYKKAMAYMDYQNYDDAIKLMENYKKEIQGHIVLQSLLATIYSENDNTQKAIRVLEELVKKDPDNAGFSVRLADAYFDRGWNKKSLQEYERAVSIDEDNLSAWIGLINCVAETQKYSKSKEYIQKAIDISEKNGWDNTKIYMLRITLAAINDDFEIVKSSIGVLKDKIKDSEDKNIQDNTAFALNGVALFAFKKGYIELADNAIDVALTILPNEEMLLEARAVIDEWKVVIKKLNELKEKNEISEVLFKLVNLMLKGMGEPCKEQTFLEVYYLHDFNTARKEIKRIRQYHPEIFDLNKDFFGFVINKNSEGEIPFQINRMIIDRELEEDFIGYIKSCGFDVSKAEELLKRAESYGRRFIDEDDFEPVSRGEKIGRNDPCICGSGKKYKKCCG